MKKLIVAVVMLGLVATLVGRYGTSASFTDRVTSSNNSFKAASLAAPSGLTACLASSSVTTCAGATTTDGSTVRLFWQSATGATGYNIYRSADGSTFTKLTSTPVTSLDYTDSNPRDASLAACTACTYKVTSAFATGGATWESLSGNPTAGPVKPLDNFLVAVPSGNQTSGVAFSTTLTARAADNTTVSNYVGTVTLSVLGPSTVSPNTAQTYTALEAGVKTLTTTITTASASVVLTATGGSPSRTGSATVSFSQVPANTPIYLANSNLGSSAKCSGSLTMQLSSSGLTGGKKKIDAGGFKIWEIVGTYSKLWNGTYTVFLHRDAGESNSSTFVAYLGYCKSDGTFQSLGNTATMTLNSSSVVSATITLSSPTTLPSGAQVALKVANTGSKDVDLATDGTSYVTGPFGN